MTRAGDIREGLEIRIRFPRNWSDGMLATVTEVKSWGVIAEVKLEHGIAPIRLEWSQIDRAPR